MDALEYASRVQATRMELKQRRARGRKFDSIGRRGFIRQGKYDRLYEAGARSNLAQRMGLDTSRVHRNGDT